MNKLFFLILLLLIPLSLSLYINSIDNVAEATSHIPIKTSKDRGSETWDLYGNATRVFKAGGGAPTQTWDWAKQSWESYVLVDLSNDDYKVQSGRISTLFSGSTITHFNSNFTDTYHAIETLKLMRNDIGVFVQIPLTFLNRTAIATQEIIQENVSNIIVNDTLDTVTVTENYSTAYGNLQIIYDYKEGESLKHTFTFTQTTTNTETYRLYHEFIMAEQEIEFESFNPITNAQIKLKVKTPTEIEFKKNNILQLTASAITQTKTDLGNSFRFTGINSLTGEHILTEIIAFSDTDLSWNNFIEVYTKAAKNPIIEFRYGDWTLIQGQSFQLDPDLFTSDNPTQDGMVITLNFNCTEGGSGTSRDSTGVSMAIVIVSGSDPNGRCKRIYVQWDITSIPSNVDVIDTVFKVRSDATGNIEDIKIRHMSTKPTTATNLDLHVDIGDGTIYDTFTWAASTTFTRDLGTTADSDVEARLVDDYFAVGMQGADESVGQDMRFEAEEETGTPDPTLEITYNLPPTYVVDFLDVYESSSTTLNSGTAICLDVNLKSASSCGTALITGNTYRFEIEVDNTGGTAGSPTTLEFRDVVANLDVLGTIPVGNILNSGCSTNTDWVESIVTNDARTVSGTTCSIASGGGSVEFWMIITIDTDANDGTGTFFIDDGTVNDVSTTTTFTVNPPITYIVNLLDVFLSSSTTLESGTAICLNVDLKSASSCGTALNAGSTYRFEIEVDNTGRLAGSPTTLEFRDVVANLDVLGTIPVGNILNSGCSTNIDWIESVVTDDARAVSGTTCSIPASGSVEFWIIITLDSDADDGTGTFFIDDGTVNDVSTTTTFTVNTSPNYTIDLLDVYESSSTTLDSGTSICLNVDLKSASSCGTALNTGSTYRFEIEVDNTGEQAGSPTTFEFRDVVATSDVFGVIPVGNILNSGCSTNTDWIESIVTDDARIVSGTTCSIPATTGSAEFWMIVTIDHDASNGTGTFFIDDGIINDVSTITTFTLNLPITDLTATATSISQIDLSWTAPTGGQPTISYKIERETPVGNGFITLVNDTGTTATTYSNTALTTKIQYNYKVSAYSITKISSSSNEDNDVTFGVPDAVTSFSITISTSSTLSFQWTSAVTYDSPVTGHKLERESPIGNGFSVISNDIGNVTAHTDTGLTVVTEYNYRLTPLSALGDGNTNTASGKTVTTPPTNLLVLPNGTDTDVLLLTWVAPVPSTDINGYQIEREAPVGGGFSVIVANTTTTIVAYNNTGLVIDTFYNYRVAALTPDGTSQVSNTYSQTTFHLPDSVDDLIATPSTLIDIVLTWTPPDKLYGYVLGYNINGTTPPTNNPLTITKADTGTSATIFTATNLDPTVTYSFRVSTITIHGKNITFANVANASATSKFVVGEINLPIEPNPNTIPISFALFTVDSDTKDLQVTFDSAMDLKCKFDYKFARSNTNYTSLTENPISGSKVYTNFTINNPDNEIIDINCVDQLDGNNTGQYRISQSSAIMPFVIQATDFQSGVFGTSGQFGAIDLVTLLVVILSMIGFNRVNPAVGVFLMIAMIGALSFYGIIGSWTIVLSGIALIAMLAIITVKKT